MTPAGSAPVGVLGADPSALAAVDVLLDRERHADELVVALCAEAAQVGGTAIEGATHWTESLGRRHVALTVAVQGLDDDRLRAAVERVLAADGATTAGVLVGSVASGPEALRPGLEAAGRAHRTRSSGRVVVFPGSESVGDLIPVGRLLEQTAVDRVVRLAEGDADPTTTLRTRRHLRPRWQAGALVLHVQAAAGGALVPFEVPDPTPCCAAHA